MMAPDMASPEEMSGMGMDPTAPPTSGGIGLSSSATAPPTKDPAPDSYSSRDGRNPLAILAGGDSSSRDIYTGDSGNSSDGNFETFGSDTQFTSESATGSNSASQDKKGGWWPFGSSN